MKVLIAGSRGWKDPRPIDAIVGGLSLLSEGRGEKLYVVHGKSPKGADRVADGVARRWGAEVIPMPILQEEFRYKKGGAGAARNQRMLDEHPDIEAVYAFRAYGKSNGTDDMVEKAKGAGIPHYVITGGEHPTD